MLMQNIQGRCVYVRDCRLIKSACLYAVKTRKEFDDET